MSRARNIKPSFFDNELLAECSPLARLLFIGLWCEADREGRLEDRPKRIKARCLPYDEAECETLLAELLDRHFIVRYSVDGSNYIAIPEFAKHQNPHQREVPSVIPAPQHEKHNLGSDKTQPRQERAGNCTGSAGLIPDSPFLIPDSSSPSAHAQASASTPEDGQLPEGVDPERWAAFRDQLADDGKLSISRIKTGLLQLRRIVAAGQDPNAVLTAAVMRGLRDLQDTASRLDKERGCGNARAGPAALAIGKTAQAIQTLEDMKHGNRLGLGRDFDGHAETAPALAGKHAGQ